MTAFALLLVTAAVAYGFAKFFRLPSIPILLGAGMVLSLTGLSPDEIEISDDGAADMLELGLVFLVFASGVELNPRRFRRFGKAVFWVAGVQFLLAMGYGFPMFKMDGDGNSRGGLHGWRSCSEFDTCGHRASEISRSNVRGPMDVL